MGIPHFEKLRVMAINLKNYPKTSNIKRLSADGLGRLGTVPSAGKIYIHFPIFYLFFIFAVSHV